MLKKQIVSDFDYKQITNLSDDILEKIGILRGKTLMDFVTLIETTNIYDSDITTSQEIAKILIRTIWRTEDEDLKFRTMEKNQWKKRESLSQKEFKVFKKELDKLGKIPSFVEVLNLIRSIIEHKKISAFKNIYDLTPWYKTLEEVLNEIKSTRYKSVISKIRKEENKYNRNKLKSKLPLILFNGLFLKRDGNYHVRFSDYMCLDFDGFPSIEEMCEAKQKLIKDKYVMACFVSPSGKGLKVIIKVNRNDLDDHLALFNGAKEYFSFVDGFDDSCKDIARSCYISYDKDIFIKKDNEIFNKKSKKKKIVTDNHHTTPNVNNKKTSIVKKNTIKSDSIFNLTDEKKIIKIIQDHWKKNNELVEGKRNNNLFKLAISLFTSGVKEDTIRKLFYNNYTGVLDIDELDGIITSACSNESKFGEKMLNDLHIYNLAKKHIANMEYLKVKLANKGIDITSPKVLDELEEFRDKVFPFWSPVYVTVEKVVKVVGYNVDEDAVLSFLKFKGIRCSSEGKNYSYYQVKNNIIYDININEIKNILLYHIRKVNPDKLLLNTFHKSNNIYKDIFLIPLSKEKPTKHLDNDNKVFKFFLNGALIIEKYKQPIMVDYGDIEEPIYHKQIILRDFVIYDSESNSDYKQFIRNISGEHFDSFCSAIGYLSTNYKKLSNAKAIVLNDPGTSFKDAMGGKGKSLIGLGISKFCNYSVMDGKNYGKDERFAFAKVNDFLDVLLIDDLMQGFRFTDLFNFITGSMETTKKHHDTTTIPFKYSPKIMLGSNYPIKGSDDSSNRRRFDLVLEDYYSSTKKPIDDFGKEFFTEWNDEEWNQFYTFMIECLQLYLENGLISMPIDSIAEKTLIGDTSEDFIFFLESNDDIYESWTSDEMINSFKSHSNMSISSKKIINWFKKWCAHKGYKLVAGRSGSRRIYTVNR